MLSTTHKIMLSSKRLEESREDVLSLQDRKNILEENIRYKKSWRYIEKVARDKLNMSLPGEEIFLYPEITEMEDQQANSTKDADNAKKDKKSIPSEKTPAEEWRDLFF